jgi:hypothetical protein
VPRFDLELETSAPPERVRAALLDFSERRPEIWPGLSREFYEVYSVGETKRRSRADPREGGGTRIRLHWEREGATLVGRLITRVIAATGGRPVRASYEKALRRLETP